MSTVSNNLTDHYPRTGSGLVCLGREHLDEILGQTGEFPFPMRCYSMDRDGEKGNSPVWSHTYCAVKPVKLDHYPKMTLYLIALRRLDRATGSSQTQFL